MEFNPEISIDFALRDEKVNIFAMTEGIDSFIYKKQIVLCKKSQLNRIGPFLLDPKKSKPEFKLSKIGNEYQKRIWGRSMPLKYIGFINCYLKIQISYNLFEELRKNGFFSIWHPSAPVKYFENYQEGYLVLFQVFEIEENRIKESILENGRKGRNYYYKLQHSINVRIVKEVIDTPLFNAIKLKLINLLRSRGWLLEIINKFYEIPYLKSYNIKELKSSELKIIESNKEFSLDELNQRINDKAVRKKKIKIKTIKYHRDPDIVSFALKRAEGICECCNKKAPFLRKNRTPYLESHHLIPLSDGGEDSIDNICAICPNCHRRLHYGINSEDMTIIILNKIKEKNRVSI